MGKDAIHADVLIVGGNLVGGALGVALAAGGLEVVAVDHEAPAAQLDAAFDGRASAIALATRRALEALGLWRWVAAHASPILDIRVTEGASRLFLHYDHREVGGEPLGHMVENRDLRHALYRRMAETPGLTVLAPATVAETRRDAGGVAAVLADGRRVSARLLVGADGRHSRVRGDAGIPVTRWDYRQTGIVCTVRHERPHRNVAHERFLPAGPFAILPLTGNRSSLVWTEPDDLAPTLLALPEAAFLAELGRRFGDFLGALGVEGRRWTYPLALQFAQRIVDTRLALVGDAAQAMHPIAGQGLNVGLRDMAALAEVLIDAHRLGLDPGDGLVLERHVRWRRADAAVMLAATDGLTRLFSNDIGPLRVARDIGLAAVNRLPPLKRLFMRHAMGTLGDLPRLLEGRAP